MVAVHALVPAKDVWRLLPRARGGRRVVDPGRARGADDAMSGLSTAVVARGLCSDAASRRSGHVWFGLCPGDAPRRRGHVWFGLLGLPTSRPDAIEPTRGIVTCLSRKCIDSSTASTDGLAGHGVGAGARGTGMSIVAEIKAEGDAAVRRWALELDGAEPAPRRAGAGPAAARGRARARRPRAPLARGAAAGRRRARGRARACVLERRWVPLGTVGVYVPRNLVSTLVMCAVPAQVAGVERIVVCTPPAGAGLVAAAAELLGIDEVWALGGPQAIGWLAYVRRVDKIVGPGNAYVNDAKLEVSRDVPIDLPGGPSEVVVVADDDADPRIVELELAAQREHGHEAVCRVVATLEEAEALAPEHLVLLGASEARAGEVRNAGAVFVGPSRAGRGRRLRDRRQPRAADRRLGALGRRARAGDVPQAGHDPADHGRGPRAAPADRRGARRRRGHDRRTRRRCSGEAARAGVRAPTPGRRRPTRSPGSRGSTPRRSCATTRTRRRCRSPRPARARSPARSPGSAATRPAATPSCGTRSPTTPASSPTRSCSAPAPTT